MKELGDKTFVIVLLFALGWSNPEGEDPGYRVAADGRMEIHHRLTHVSPVRIIVLATLGTVYMDLDMTGATKPGKERFWVFASSIILVYCLLNYAFRLMSAHFAIVTRLEAEYERTRGKEAEGRNNKIQRWAAREIETSRDFNEEHMESVFDALKKANNVDDLSSKLKENETQLFRELKNLDGATEERLEQLEKKEDDVAAL